MDDRNPFQPPVTKSLADSADESNFDWRDVLRRWERLRVSYNLIVGVVGLWGMYIQPTHGLHPVLWVEAFVYAVAANICYLFGPTAELYLRWLGVHNRYVTLVLFVLGTLFSVLVTAGLAALSVLLDQAQFGWG